jgi:hypothetical protein
MTHHYLNKKKTNHKTAPPLHNKTPQGLNIEARDEYGRTALYAAAEAGSADAVRPLNIQ